MLHAFQCSLSSIIKRESRVVLVDTNNIAQIKEGGGLLPLVSFESYLPVVDLETF